MLGILSALWLMGAGVTFLLMMMLLTQNELSLSGPEFAVWIIFWPVCHTFAAAKYLAKGIVGLWKRL